MGVYSMGDGVIVCGLVECLMGQPHQHSPLQNANDNHYHS